MQIVTFSAVTLWVPQVLARGPFPIPFPDPLINILFIKLLCKMNITLAIMLIFGKKAHVILLNYSVINTKMKTQANTA